MAGANAHHRGLMGEPRVESDSLYTGVARGTPRYRRGGESMAESTTLQDQTMSPARCPRCNGTLITGAAESEPICLNCGYVAYASGLTPQAAEAELSNRPSLPIATAADLGRHAGSE